VTDATWRTPRRAWGQGQDAPILSDRLAAFAQLLERRGKLKAGLDMLRIWSGARDCVPVHHHRLVEELELRQPFPQALSGEDALIVRVVPLEFNGVSENLSCFVRPILPRRDLAQEGASGVSVRQTPFGSDARAASVTALNQTAAGPKVVTQARGVS
jgi:hypothetical protein